MRKKLSPRGRIRPRLFWLLLLAPPLLLAAYAAAARWMLSGPKVRTLINADPESLTLDYDAATSLWPGRVTIRNLRIRGSDQNVQWIIQLAEARVDYSVWALGRRTFKATRLRGKGLSFHLRNKLEPLRATATAKAASSLPAIPGFADPPLRTAEEQGPEPLGDPWRVDVRSVFIDHFDDIWIDACHYTGTARLEGGFFLRPGILAEIYSSRVEFERGAVHIGNQPAGATVSGMVSAFLEPWEPFRVHGSQVWQKTSGKVKLDASFDRIAFLQHLVSAETLLEDGKGKATIRGTIEQGTAKGGAEVQVRDGSLRLAKLTLQGHADLHIQVPRWNLETGPLDVSGSRIALSEIRTTGSDDSRRWWGRFKIPSGTIGSAINARIETQSRDARPLLALLASDLPSWTRGLLTLEDFSAAATVSVGPSLTRLRGLDAAGGSFHIQGSYLRDKATRDGAFLIESGILSVGVELQPVGTKIRLLGAKKWFEQQRQAQNEPAPSRREPSRDRAAAVGLERVLDARGRPSRSRSVLAPV